MWQAALFELEGVLADTRAVRRDALRRALADDGVALAPEQYDAWCAGLDAERAVDEALRRLAPHSPAAEYLDDTARALVARRAERDAAARLAAGTSLMPGARAALDALGATLRLGIVTRAGRAECDAVLALAGLDDAFACVITADEVRAPKPAADGYRLALRRLARHGVAGPAGVVAFEDAPAGVAAARAAGVRVVRVGSGDSAADEAADACVWSLAGLTPRTLAPLLDPDPVLT